MAGQPERGPRLYAVVLLVTAIVATVLLVIIAGWVVPSVARALASLPVVVIVLVVGTLIVLLRALRR